MPGETPLKTSSPPPVIMFSGLEHLFGLGALWPQGVPWVLGDLGSGACERSPAQLLSTWQLCLSHTTGQARGCAFSVMDWGPWLEGSAGGGQGQGRKKPDSGHSFILAETNFSLCCKRRSIVTLPAGGPCSPGEGCLSSSASIC